jgi:hypothetical protein
VKAMGHYRLASAAAGDDATFTRYVRNERANHTKKPRRHSPRIPGLELSWVASGHTKFPTRVLPPSAMKSLLVSGHSNVKIGRDVRKGKLRGYWIFTLSLEERATCPRSCAHWSDCYGNNMPFAKRVDHTAADFLSWLEADLVRELATRGRRGVLVRLHALGDFYAPEYVSFWDRMLREHKNLALYGYTARMADTPIGTLLHELNQAYGHRCMIRFSDGGYREMSTVGIVEESACPPGAFVCPEQTGKTLGCGTCGACWGTTKNVAFLAH